MKWSLWEGCGKGLAEIVKEFVGSRKELVGRWKKSEESEKGTVRYEKESEGFGRGPVGSGKWEQV